MTPAGPSSWGLWFANRFGSKTAVELVGAGSSVGKALMFTGRPCIINGRTLIDTLLLAVRKDAVVGGIESDPRFAMRMLAGISRRLHGLVCDVEADALHSGVQRVIGYLLRGVAQGVDNRRTMTDSLEVSKATVASRLTLTCRYLLARAAGAGFGWPAAHRQARRANSRPRPRPAGRLLRPSRRLIGA